MALTETQAERQITNNDSMPDLPGVGDRTVIVGQTGSGKTVFGVWLLSLMDYDRRPWVVIDYKRETLFRQLGRNTFRSLLTPDSAAPKKPGLHLIQPFESDDEAIDDFLWRCWRQGGVGIYIDEAMMIPAGRGSAMRTILTQGRSLKIPVIALSQRPVEVDRYFFSESQFFAEFFLMDREDRVTLKRYAPFDPDVVPERYRCFWYDSKKRETTEFMPVPDIAAVLDRIRSRAPRRIWWG